MAGAGEEPRHTQPDTPTGRADRFLVLASNVFYAVAASALGLFSLLLIGLALWTMATTILAAGPILHQTLESIGLVTIAAAVFGVAKFLAEEELIGDRQLRSVIEARRSLTKFFTIVIIAISLEGIVLAFEVKLEEVRDLFYPTALIAVGVLALIGLGLFMRLSAEGGSNRIGPDSAHEHESQPQPEPE